MQLIFINSPKIRFHVDRATFLIAAGLKTFAQAPQKATMAYAILLAKAVW
jgi:hypothetical protein